MAEVRLAGVEIVRLGQAAEDPVDRRIGGERRRGRGRVGRLAVVDEAGRRSSRRPAPSGAAGRDRWRAPAAIASSRRRARATRPRPRRSAHCAAPAAPASATGPSRRSTRPGPCGPRAGRRSRGYNRPRRRSTATWSGDCIANRRALDAGISVDAVIAVEMIGADVEQHGDVAIEAMGQIDLIGGQLEHIDAALRQRLLAEDRKADIAAPSSPARRRSSGYGGPARWWSTCRWCR